MFVILRGISESKRLISPRPKKSKKHYYNAEIFSSFKKYRNYKIVIQTSLKKSLSMMKDKRNVNLYAFVIIVLELMYAVRDHFLVFAKGHGIQMSNWFLFSFKENK